MYVLILNRNGRGIHSSNALTHGQARGVSKRPGRGCFKSKRADLLVLRGRSSIRQAASKVMSTATTKLRQFAAYRFPPVVGTVNA